MCPWIRVSVEVRSVCPWRSDPCVRGGLIRVSVEICVSVDPCVCGHPIRVSVDLCVRGDLIRVSVEV